MTHHEIVLLLSIVLMAWQVTVSFMKYYTYPVKTQILYKNAGQVEFPAVTICNLNPLRVSQLCDDGVMSGFKKVRPDAGITFARKSHSHLTCLHTKSPSTVFDA